MFWMAFFSAASAEWQNPAASVALEPRQMPRQSVVFLIIVSLVLVCFGLWFGSIIGVPDNAFGQVLNVRVKELGGALVSSPHGRRRTLRGRWIFHAPVEVNRLARRRGQCFLNFLGEADDDVVVQVGNLFERLRRVPRQVNAFFFEETDRNRVRWLRVQTRA